MKNLIIVAAASALFVYGCQSSAPADFSKSPANPGQQFILSMVSKYKGDASKLTPEERQKMDQITHGNTDMVMKAGAKK
jgi:hypothetical protein